MQREMELQQIIFHIIETQIKFGGHRYGDQLPTLREASSYFLASLDTVRLAYLRLKREGYISISTCVGATVNVDYSDEEIRRHIQRYFGPRKEPLLSFAQSVGLLANRVQWYALMSATPETLDELEYLCFRQDEAPVYRMSRQLQLLYAPLGNELLLRLFWQMFLYFQGPFVSTARNGMIPGKAGGPLSEMIRLARKKDGEALWEAGQASVLRYQAALNRFFDQNITPETVDEPVGFTWGIYKKTSQLCYSICMDLLLDIHNGVYQDGDFLPPPQQLAHEKQAGLNTVRRAIGLLNKLGAVRSLNGVGTQVLPPVDSAKNCDFEDPVIRRRLVDFLQSFHILAFSCRTCAQAALNSMSEKDILQLIQRLDQTRQSGVYENLMYVCYDTIALHSAPLVRTVYGEVTRQLFWGYPLREMHGDRPHANAYFLPYLDSLRDCLVRRDVNGFSLLLEKLHTDETACIIRYLSGLGIREAASIIIPE